MIFFWLSNLYIRFFIIFVIVKITWSENGVIMKAFSDSFENSEKNFMGYLKYLYQIMKYVNDLNLKYLQNSLAPIFIFEHYSAANFLCMDERFWSFILSYKSKV